MEVGGMGGGEGGGGRDGWVHMGIGKNILYHFAGVSLSHDLLDP